MSQRLFASIGNTTLHWALERDGSWAANGRIGWNRQTDPLGALKAVCGVIPEEFIVCVSNPAQLAPIEAALGAHVRVMGRDFTGGIAVEYRDPRQVGADRLASATAAATLYEMPGIVISAGTCLTCEVISAAGTLIGGAIAPGLPVYLKGLQAAVPHLPTLTLDDALLEREAREPGQTTVENLALGVCLSLVGAAEEIVGAMANTIGAPATILLTGGDAPIIERHSDLPWIVAPLLTLEGLRIIHDGC